MPRKADEPVIDTENPEWSDEDFARARPLQDVLPDLVHHFRKVRGGQKAPRKVPISLRLSPDVVERFKADGPGWQSRMDEALRKAAGL